MAAEQNYDIIIIGSGAGGGTLAYALAATGLKILILERGSYLKREKENWDPSSLFIDNRYTSKETWKDRQGNDFQPGIHYFVGGSTKLYGAALLRLREKDFGEVQHKDGISPAWPLNYTDFKPYYLQAEKLYTVHGQRGADPTEPHDENPYPYPHLPHEPRIQEIYDGILSKGIQAFPLPLGIRRNEQDVSHSQCIRCDTCDGFPCLVDAKSDAHTTCINPAIKYPNVRLITNAKVIKLNTDSLGKRITGVETEINGTDKQIFSANVVVVSCGAINSAALLLRSANQSHPNGLANSSGLLGCNYMCHNNSAIIAASRIPNPTLFQKTIGINDYYYGASDWNYPLGHIQLLGKVKKEMILADLPHFTPSFPVEVFADHCIGWWITTEDLPRKENRVTVDQEGNITLSYKANNEESHKRLFNKLKEILAHIGYEEHIFTNNVYFRKKIPIAGCAHQIGTCKFGNNPKASVLDVNCKAHDLDNLYVVDGSFFPCSGAVNPGLTIIANALRVSDVLCQRFGKQREQNLTCHLESFYTLPSSKR